MSSTSSDVRPARETSAVRENTTPWAVKLGALVLLTLQNSTAALLMRQSQSAGKSIAQTLVIFQECVKLLSSTACILLGGESLWAVVESPRELLRASVPAALYLLQNNLQYVAVQHLDAATYTVTYQLKILSTALLSVALLNRRLELRKWAALLLLVLGVALVQLAEARPAGDRRRSEFVGLVAVLAATALSGLAGVYTEKILKDSPLSLPVRNAQLAGHSLIAGLLVLLLSSDFKRLRSEGPTVGYTAWTVASILNNGFGGLLISAVMKYTDNILKNFSTSISIILTTVISANFLGLEVSSVFLLGISLVCYSTFLYSNTDPLEWLCSKKLLFAAKKE